MEALSPAKRWLLAFLVSTFLMATWFALTYFNFLNWNPVTWVMNAIDESAGSLGTITVLLLVWVGLTVAIARAMRVRRGDDDLG